jgi:EmrB/QacA subfamily drug resistance transporter
MNSRQRLWWTFALTSLALFAFALDRLVVTIALPSIRADLGGQVADLEWTVNAYTLSFAVLLLTGGALGDRFGRRRMFTIGVAVFTAGSAGAALAPTMGTLVAARALQGVGGALFSPLTLTMLSAVTPPARRGAVLGAWGGIGGLGAALGPLAGGALAGSVGWRAIFWLNVPVGLALIGLGRLRLEESHGPRRKLDLAGVALVSAGLFGVVWAVIRLGAVGWASADVPVALGVGVVLLLVFLGWEVRTPAPMLPMRFFRHRVFTAGALASLAMYSALFGAVFLIAQLLQAGLGATPLQAGLRALPMAVMPMLLAPAGGVVADRIGFRPLMIGGLAVEAIALGWLAVAVRPAVSYGFLVPPLMLVGMGSAVFFAPLASAMLSAVAPQEQGQASGAATAIRELAAAAGVAVLGLVFAGHGGYASRADFVGGFIPAMWLAAGLAAAGVLAAVALPRAGGTAVRGLTDPRARWENKARGSAPAGAAVRAADARHGR